MKKKSKMHVLPHYAAGIFAVAYGFIFPLYRWFDFIFYAVGIFVLFTLLRAAVPKPKPLAAKTGNADLDDMAVKGAEAIYEMRALNDVIKHAALSRQIDELESTTRDIFAFIAKNPDKVREVRTFINYYLPTTMKLLRSYSEMATQKADGDNIKTSMKKIENVMDVIVQAFKKQLDDLYTGVAMDIAAEIKILEYTMNSEGIKGT